MTAEGKDRGDSDRDGSAGVGRYDNDRVAHVRDIRHVARMYVEHYQKQCGQTPNGDEESRDEPGMDFYCLMHQGFHTTFFIH
jgi:hypothetical protein